MSSPRTSAVLRAQLFTEFVGELNGELHAKNEKAVVLVHNPSHTLTGCVKRTSTVEGFVMEELTRVKVVQTFGVMPAAAFSAINGVVDTLKAVFRTWFLRTAVTSTEWTRAGIFLRPPLHEVLRSCRRVSRMVHDGFVKQAEALGIPPRDVPKEARVVNEEVVSRLRRTPTKRNRTDRSSDEGITSDASDEAGQSRKAGVLFPVEDDKESVVRLV
ncbi:unnamed protein product [Closterium sp. NIES-65]|nr:unnamed protein product [Closterium sp. NIES-65]